MRVPRWVIVGAAVVMALPFGWGLGVVAAYLLAGKEFGQLPIVTVPLGILASVVFAVVPSMEAERRLAILAVGTLVLIALARLIG